MLFTMLMLFAFYCLTNKYSRQHGKYEGLYKRHQHFDKINKYRKGNRKRCRTPARKFIHVPKNKYQRNQTDDDDMTCHHVCKQTYNESKGLDEYAYKFYWHQDKFHTQRYIGRIENMTPVMFIRTEKNDHERYNSQYRRKGNIAADIG